MDLIKNQVNEVKKEKMVVNSIEQFTVNLEIEKFKSEQIRQAIITVTMIDIEHQKLLATVSTLTASLKKDN